MKFTIAAIVFSVASAVQGGVVRRIDGCPPLAPWPAGSPGNFWYNTCCAYNLAWDQCCNRDSPAPVFVGDKELRSCSDPAFSA
ncbi:hypothetical protein B0J11DRAFT_297716 [Dendryphion nanum]|uniref:Uncharacterized protein n=1 Tax=Dendryphion nanum TaxID=256645 RepID=A0A9P9INX0_9PLEO|nr:hypothetical protein B0J11DRAFT_297716 [Dendryphion nanum]